VRRNYIVRFHTHPLYGIIQTFTQYYLDYAWADISLGLSHAPYVWAEISSEFSLAPIMGEGFCEPDFSVTICNIA